MSPAVAGLPQRLLAEVGEAAGRAAGGGPQGGAGRARAPISGSPAPQTLAEAHGGLQEVELAEQPRVPSQVGERRPRPARSARPGCGGAPPPRPPPTAGGSCSVSTTFERLEVEAPAGRRAAVDEAAAPSAGAGLEHHDQPAAAHRNGLLRQLVLVAGHELAEVAVDLLAHGADLPAQGGEPRAGVLAHLAPAVEPAVDPPQQGTRSGSPRTSAASAGQGGRLADPPRRRRAWRGRGRPAAPGRPPRPAAGRWRCRARRSPSGTSKSGTSARSPTSRDASSNRVRRARRGASCSNGWSPRARSRPRSVAAKRETTASRLGNSSACAVA